MKIAVLGFAHGHVDAYCNRWRACPDMGIEVVAGWDHDADRLARAAAQHGIAGVASLEDVLGMPGIDAVVVAAETSRHAELVERAAVAAKAIVLQKPMALTMEEADRIVAAVERNGVPFTVAWQMRVDPQNLKIKGLIDSGDFGRLFMVRRRHGLGVMLNPAFLESWHVRPELNRDIWADDAAHPIDFIYWLLGKPCSVWSDLGTLLDPSYPNDNGIAVFRYDDGLFAEVSCSFTCLAHENTTEVIAENGVIVQNYGDAPSTAMKPPGAICLKWYLKGRKEWTVSDMPGVGGQGERIANLAGPLADFLSGRRPPIATAEEGREALRMVLACYESSEQGRRVSLEEAGH
ncbi:Gfo/Idh/MocA family protein [Verrucomicrobiota bacterium]